MKPISFFGLSCLVLLGCTGDAPETRDAASSPSSVVPDSAAVEPASPSDDPLVDDSLADASLPDDSLTGEPLAPVVSSDAVPEQACPGLEAPLAISRDCLGSIPLWATLQEIVELAPDARDTLYATPVDHRLLPAKGLELEGLHARAVQFGPDLAMTAPPAFWMIWGSGAQLPGEVPLEATWGRLREAYGDAVGSTESGETRVRFGSQPQFLFTLDADPEVVGSIEVTGDLSRIPVDAVIVRVLIGPSG